MAIIGMDIHRSFAQATFLRDGQIKREQRVDLVHDHLVKFAKTLSSEDEVVIEATGNSAAVERILRPFVNRVVVANPRMVRPTAYARPASTAMKLRKAALKAGAPRECGKAVLGHDYWIKEIRERENDYVARAERDPALRVADHLVLFRLLGGLRAHCLASVASSSARASASTAFGSKAPPIHSVSSAWRSCFGSAIASRKSG